jgi:Holliday junction DNA helicase RuvA
MLQIHTHVREDAITLFGFNTPREKSLFLKLISVSGIGPKLGIAILSGAKVEELAKSIADADLSGLTAIPGVGKRTAERVVLELKGQIGRFLAPDEVGEPRDGALSDGLQEDILSALVNLGYPKASAEKTLARVLQSGECERSFEDVLKHTLRSLAK